MHIRPNPAERRRNETILHEERDGRTGSGTSGPVQHAKYRLCKARDGFLWTSVGAKGGYVGIFCSVESQLCILGDWVLQAKQRALCHRCHLLLRVRVDYTVVGKRLVVVVIVIGREYLAKAGGQFGSVQSHMNEPVPPLTWKMEEHAAKSMVPE